jgi:hypothetical protein
MSTDIDRKPVDGGCRGGRVGRHHADQFTPASTAVPGASVLTLTARL